MGLSDLSEIEIIHGSFALLFVAISVLLGFRILLKYFKHKRKELITIGLTWILMSSGWWGVAINFPLNILFDIMISATWELGINHIFIPIALVCWIYTFTSLTYSHLKKPLVVIYSILGTIFDILSIYFLFTNPDLVGKKTGTFNVTISLFTLSFIGFALVTTLITGILFARKLLQSEDIVNRWKGKIILIAFLSFVIGAVFDAAVPLNAISLVIVRIVLISSAFEYYIGFLMPEKLSEWIIERAQNK
ncbi:MAG: hypothetical protein EU539_05390 [Promethearchaeota archaeon]|nr:MAG: hypothetical protein EU539_05390 [Candidatus Lokiarchaeota archaeon]